MLSLSNILGFCEFLLACGLSPRAIDNYVSAVKSYLSTFQLPVHWMQSTVLSNYLRALNIQIPTVKKVKYTLSLSDFSHISQLLGTLDNPHVYRVAFMLSFFFFLRISNLVPPRQQAFDINRQLCVRYITLTTQGVYVFLRWAKNLQRTDQSHTVCIPRMSRIELCPVRAFQRVLPSGPYPPLQPVVSLSGVPLIESQLRRRLACVLRIAGLPSEGLTYHSLRCSGASLAFNNNVDFNAIRSQGAWSSDSIWQYLFSNSQKVNEVPRMFQRLENSI